MRDKYIWTWLDDWLARLVRPSLLEGSPLTRLRAERFILTRAIGACLASAASLPYLLLAEFSSSIDVLIVVVLASQLAAALLMARTGHALLAQVSVSLPLTAFATLVGAGGPVGLLALAMPIIDSALNGTPRSIAATVGMAILAVPLILWLPPAGPEGLVSVLFVVAVFGIGYAVAQFVADGRVKEVLASTHGRVDIRTASALDAIDDLVTWHDPDGFLVNCNCVRTRRLGLSAADLNGQGFFRRVHVTDRPAFLRALSDASRSSQGIVLRFRLQIGSGSDSALGTVAWVEMRACRITESNGPTGIVAVTRDISDLMAQIADADTRHRKALVLAEQRMLLLATVSHELRTPLTALVGYSELLSDTNRLILVEKRQDYALAIRQSGEHLLGIVNTLLDLSTIEAGHYELSPELIEVAPLVRECCAVMALQADRAGVIIAPDIAPNLPDIFADRRACQQILLNLLSNAIKFTPPGGLVTLAANREGERLVWTVRDTGIGVAESELSQLGAPFYRGRRSKKEPGNGLGLSVVRGLVGLHNGRLAIASAPGLGTTVFVTLPVDGCPSRHLAPADIQTEIVPCPGDTTIRHGMIRLA